MPDTIKVRLLHSGRQPGKALDEPLIFGLQDKSGGLLSGIPVVDGRLRFEVELSVRQRADGELDFAGSHVHGKPGGRFMYLGWKRDDPGSGAGIWGWRIKVPLQDLALNLVDGLAAEDVLTADCEALRPHARASVAWRAGP